MISAVADAVEHAAERPGIRPERSHPLMILEPGDERQIERRVGLDQQLTDRARPGTDRRRDIEKPEPRLDAFRAGKALADDLIAGAHREDHRAAGVGPVDRAARAELASGQCLRTIFAPTEQVQISRLGNRRRIATVDALDGDAAPPQSVFEHDAIAAVAVRAEQLGQHDGDPYRRFAGHRATPNARRTSRNAV